MEKTDMVDVDEMLEADRPLLEDLQETAGKWLDLLTDWARYVEEGGELPIPMSDAYGQIGVQESGTLRTVFACRFKIGNLTVDGEVAESHGSFDETDEEASAVSEEASENILALLDMATAALKAEHDGCEWLANDPDSRLELRVARDGLASYALIDGNGRTVESADGWQGAVAILDRIVERGGSDGTEMIRV